MATSREKPSKFRIYNPEHKLHIHRSMKGYSWVVRKEGDYPEKIRGYRSLEKAIEVARARMIKDDIFKLSLHNDDRSITFIEEEKISKNSTQKPKPTLLKLNNSSSEKIKLIPIEGRIITRKETLRELPIVGM